MINNSHNQHIGKVCALRFGFGETTSMMMLAWGSPIPERCVRLGGLGGRQVSIGEPI